jgi:hypothetical protein
MLKRKTICSSFLLLILSFNTARAQNEVPKGNRSSAATITASASGERVRFTAPSSVVQIRLEIYNSTGTKLVDNEVRGGNVLDWHLQGGQAEPLPDDSYLCVVTVKSLSGKLTQRIGSVTVEKSSASLQPVDASQVTAQQSQAIGPVEENASWIVLNEDEKQTTTVIAHNGTEGQITRGRGALTFRIGDFFSGKDTEQMRLTAEGNLGIGTSDPQVKLDVAGMIGAREGVMFSDGSTLRVNKKGVLTHSKGGGDVSISAAGTGTLNRLAKWTETGGAGGLGDSVVTESASGFLGIGTAAPVSALELAGSGVNGSGGITLGTGAVAKSVYQVINAAGEIISFFGGNVFVDGSLLTQRFNTSQVGWAVALDGRDSQDLFKLERLSAAGVTTRPALIRGDGSFGFGNMTSPPNLTGATFMMDSAGNVGIGTTNPQAKLDVAGDIQVSGNAVIAGNIAAKYQDLAEWVPAQQKLEAGTVLSVDLNRTNSVVPSARAYDIHIAGVVSSQPGVILGQYGPGKVMVATTGRVKVKVDATRHPIKIGDLLVTSGRSGLAMKSLPIRVAGNMIHRPGTIIGKALEPLSKGKGEILVLLSLQ